MMSSIGTTSLRCPPRPSFLCVLLVGIGLWSAHEWRWWTEPPDLDEITWAFSDPERDGFTSHWPTLSITNAIGRDVLFCYDLKLPESFTPKNQDGEVESSNVKAPQALCIHLTRELAIQNMEVLQKMGKYTGINAKCVVPTERTSSTSIQSRAPVSAQIVIGTHGTIKKWMSIKKLGVTRRGFLTHSQSKCRGSSNLRPLVCKSKHFSTGLDPVGKIKA
ncbi:unnamed protein product [Prunus armeniaca]